MEVKEIIVTFAEVEDDASGILICYTEEKGKKAKESRFIPIEALGKVPEGKDPKKELQDIADLLNGFKKVGNEIVPIPGWTPRKIKIED